MATRSRSSKYVNFYDLLTCSLFFIFHQNKTWFFTPHHFCVFDYLFFFSVIIINYHFTYATLGHLVESVKPTGRLKNTVAEVGIYVINGKKTRAASRRVLPLYVSVSPLHVI